MNNEATTNILFQILSRMKPAVGAGSSSDHQNSTKNILTLEEFLKKRDYTGAITLLEVSI